MFRRIWLFLLATVTLVSNNGVAAADELVWETGPCKSCPTPQIFTDEAPSPTKAGSDTFVWISPSPTPPSPSPIGRERAPTPEPSPTSTPFEDPTTRGQTEQDATDSGEVPTPISIRDIFFIVGTIGSLTFGIIGLYFSYKFSMDVTVYYSPAGYFVIIVNNTSKGQDGRVARIEHVDKPNLPLRTKRTFIETQISAKCSFENLSTSTSESDTMKVEKNSAAYYAVDPREDIPAPVNKESFKKFRVKLSGGCFRGPLSCLGITRRGVLLSSPALDPPAFRDHHPEQAALDP